MRPKRLELERKERDIAAREAQLNREKHMLAVERIRLDAKKSIVSAGQVAPRVTVPFKSEDRKQQRFRFHLPQGARSIKMGEDDDVFIKQEAPENDMVSSFLSRQHKSRANTFSPP